MIGRRYAQVAIVDAVATTCIGDQTAALQAAVAGRSGLVQDPTWGWLGKCQDGNLHDLALGAACRAWRAIAEVPEPLAFSASASKGDIAALITALAGQPELLVPALAGGLDAPLARALGIRSWVGTPVAAACSTGLHGMLAAADLIEDGSCGRALVGAADRSLVPVLLAGFDNMGVLCGHRHPLESSKKDDRQGFAPAEGAGFIALQRGKGPWRLLGGVRLGDARHETHFQDPRTLSCALEALWAFCPDPELLVVHGTGTNAGELYERAGLDTGPWATAPRLILKPIIGHCLGASSTVELAIAMQSKARRIWKLSLGFGGHLAAVAVQRD